MAGAPQRKPSRLSVELFRGFLEGRPDEEHWELIDGVAVMMAPPTLAHQRIASNLQLLLNEALERQMPALSVYQPAGLNLAPPVENYDPKPDVVVIDSDASEQPGERYANRFYLVAEIVSASDRTGSLRSACRPAHERWLEGASPRQSGRPPRTRRFRAAL